MERIEALITKLKEQYDQKEDIAQLLMTVQALQFELSKNRSSAARVLGTSKVAVVMPGASAALSATAKKNIASSNTSSVKEVKETLLLENDSVSVLQKNGQLDMVFDPLKDIPTLSQQEPVKEIHELSIDEGESLNDRLKVSKAELVEVLKETPIKDLRKAIGINDRFLFINELFRGDETMYERSIKTINGFNIYPEAEYWINRELKIKLGWETKNDAVLLFDQLVKRRFS